MRAKAGTGCGTCFFWFPTLEAVHLVVLTGRKTFIFDIFLLVYLITVLVDKSVFALPGV